MREKILVVEDELVLRETLAYNLTKNDYEVFTADDGHKAVAAARQEHPDLIVLDIMLPGIDGFEICRILRQEMSVPIIMLTARADVVDRVVGLEMGADDYLTKPFSLRELLARVKAQLRRVRLLREEYAVASSADDHETTQVGTMVVDFDRREVRKAGELLVLKPKEYDLLAYLVENRGKVMSRDRILQQVWGWEFSGGSRTVDVHIRWLREKIEDDPAHPVSILTVRGIGYRFEG